MLRLSQVLQGSFILTTVLASGVLGQPAERDRGPRSGPPVLTVTGEGKASATPDRATVRVGAIAQAEEASAAQAEVSEIVSKTIEAINKHIAAKTKTTSSQQ